MPTSKADAETWFNSNIRGEMERHGHQIDWVKGDKFQFTNWQGTFVVDFVRGADVGRTRRWPGRSSSDRRRPVRGTGCYTLRPAMADAIEILKAHAYGNDFLYASAEAVAAPRPRPGRVRPRHLRPPHGRGRGRADPLHP